MKKALSLLLAAVMLMSIIPLAAFSVSAETAFTYRANKNGEGASSDYQSGKYYSNLTKISLTGDQRTDVLAVALSQLGYEEGNSSSQLEGTSGGSSNYTEYCINTTGKSSSMGQAYAWCAAFCSWALYQSRVSNHNLQGDMYRSHSGSSSYYWAEIYCPYWVTALTNAGYFKKSAYRGGTYTPQSGDLIFFYNSSLSEVSHIGMVVYTDGTNVYTVEGNTSDSSGVEANGGGVYFKSYSLSYSRICGYGALPYTNDTSIADIDYSGANPTAGLWITNSYKYLYADEACTTRATYGDGVYCDIPRFTMFEATGVTSNKKALKVSYDGVTGYIAINSDRVIQVTTNSASAPDRDTAGNLLYGKTSYISGTGSGYGMYNASLTDAYTAEAIDYVDDQWFGFYANSEDTSANNAVYDETKGWYGTAVYALGNTYNLSKLGVHYLNLTENGIAPPSYIKAYASTDGSTYTEIPATFSVSGSGTTVWSEVSVSDVTASHIKFEIGLSSAFAMIDEIEAFGSLYTGGSSSGGTVVTGAQAFTGTFNTADSGGTKALLFNDTDTAGEWWIRASFKHILGDVYKVVAVNGSVGDSGTTALDVPINGFVIAVHDTCTTPGLYNYISNLTVGSQVDITGLDINAETLASDSTIKVRTTLVDEAPNVDSVNNPVFIRGIDISEHQSGVDYVDFNKLKASGCEFVILRVHNGNRYDYDFEEYYKAARAAGMKLGAYMYTYATSPSTAKSQAQMLIDYFEANGMYFEFPIYFDLEEQAHINMTSANITALSTAWCETLEDAGYYPGIYTGIDIFNKLTSDFKSKYDVWGAFYRSESNPYNWDSIANAPYPGYTKPTYSYGYSMWQYSCWNTYNGAKVYDGVYTNTSHTTIVSDLDLNVCYKDYDAITSYYGYNNREATGGGPNRETEGNVLYGKNPVISGSGVGFATDNVSYKASLTDASIADTINYETPDEWFGFYYGDQTDGINTIVRENSDVYGTVTFDLGDTYNLTKIGVHYLNTIEDAGIAAPEYFKAFTSTDGTNYTEIPVAFAISADGTTNWSEITVSDVSASYLKLEIGLQSSFAMIDEIEAFGTSASGGSSGGSSGDTVTDSDLLNPDGTKAIIYTEKDNANLWWIRASFKPVSGNIYQVVEVDNKAGSSSALAVPANGFVLTAHELCETAGMYSFVKNLTAGTKVQVTGVDLTKSVSACDTVFTIVSDDTSSDVTADVTTDGTKALLFTKEDLGGPWWIRASFIHVEGDVYEVVSSNNVFNEYGTNVLPMPNNGFVLAVHDKCETEGLYNLVLGLEPGEKVVVTGLDLSKEVSECTATFSMYTEPDTSEPDTSDDESSEPIVDNESSEPVVDNESSEPVIDDESSEPIVDDESSEPVVDNESSEPIVDGESSEPVVDNESSEPIVDDESSEPVVDDDSSEPIEDDNTSEPGDETSEPDVDPGDGSGDEPEKDYILGDINRNGEIDSLDYILLKRAYFGTFILDEDQINRGDINKNAQIDSLDYILLKRAFFGTYVITQ